MQRPHPLQRARLCRALAPAHRFRPRESPDDDRQHVGQHVQRGAAGFFDQRDIEIALLGIALDFCLIERGKTGGFEKARDRRVRPADPRSPALFLQIRLARGNAVHRQRQPPRRRERLGALIDQPLGDQPVGDHAAQIVGRLRLHPRGNFFGEKFEQKIGHLLYSPPLGGRVACRGQVGWGDSDDVVDGLKHSVSPAHHIVVPKSYHSIAIPIAAIASGPRRGEAPHHLRAAIHRPRR